MCEVGKVSAVRRATVPMVRPQADPSVLGHRVCSVARMKREIRTVSVSRQELVSLSSQLAYNVSQLEGTEATVEETERVVSIDGSFSLSAGFDCWKRVLVESEWRSDLRDFSRADTGQATVVRMRCFGKRDLEADAAMKQGLED